MKHLSKQNLIFLSVAALTGFLAGIFGIYFYLAVMTQYLISDLILPKSDQLGQREVVIKEARNVVVEQDLKVTQLSDQVYKASFGVYRKKTFGKNTLDQFYSPDEFLAQSIAITSDGWLAAYYPNELSEKTSVIVKGDKVYEVVKVINDPVTKLKFINVKDLSAPVIEFANRQNMADGQTVAIFGLRDQGVKIAHIEDINGRLSVSKADLVQSFESYDQRLLLDSEVGTRLAGAPVISLNGQLVGIFTAGNQAIKINYLNAQLKSILKNEKIVRPYLGFNYLDLRQAQGSALYGDGVMIVRSASGITIRPDSSFIKLLREGDVITAVNDIKVSPENNFIDSILDYKTGSKIKFLVRRADKDVEVETVLSER